MTGESQIERVMRWFARGQLLAPDFSEPSFVDLGRALLTLAGAREETPGGNTTAILDQIRPAEHHVFVLLDGLGHQQLQAILPAGTFLRRHLVGRLRAVFPSTTACALTSLATGEWPGRHGITGWWTYLPDRKVCAVTLPFSDRATGQPLNELGIGSEELLPLPSRWGGLKGRSVSLLPEPVHGTPYSLYASGGNPTVGYADVPDALETVRREIRDATGPLFVYLYLPQFDSLVHSLGTEHADCFALVRQLDRLLAELRSDLPTNSRLIVSADHGLVDTPPGKTYRLPPDDPLVVRLETWPSGERTNPIFHVRTGQEAAFAAGFIDRFGLDFALLTPEQADALRLLGPDGLSPVTRRRLGTFLGIGAGSAQLLVEPADGSRHQLVGVHGGLSPQEMFVPLIVA